MRISRRNIFHCVSCRFSVVERGLCGFRNPSRGVPDVVILQTTPTVVTRQQAKEYKERRKARLSRPESTPLLEGHQSPSRSPSPLPVVAAPPLRALCTTPVTIAVLNYSLLALSEISFTAMLPVYLASTPLSLTPREIGILIGSMGIFNGIIQSLCTAALVEKWGAKRVHQFAICAFFPLWVLFPIAVSIATADNTGSYPWALWLLTCIGVVFATFVSMSFSKRSSLLFLPYSSFTHQTHYRHYLPIHSLRGSNACSSRSDERIITDHGFTHADDWPSLCYLTLCRL